MRTLKDIQRQVHQLEPWWNKFCLEPIISRTTWFFVNFTKFKPNQITWIGFIFILLSALFFLKGNLILGAVFFEIRYILDYVDGRVARLKGLSSKYGAFIDNYTGVIGLWVVSIALCFGQFNASKEIVWLLLCPFILFVITHHLWETNKVALLLKDKFDDLVIGDGTDTTRGFLVKHGIQEPANIDDMLHIMFVFAPIIGFGYLKEAIIISVILLLIKTIFWFFYYRGVLK